MEYIIRRTSDHLEHHGILGQKWGVRRFQNPDGSLTAAGKRRYVREIKRGFDKQRTKEFRAVMRGDYDAIRDSRKNEHELQKKIIAEVEKTKEYKDYDRLAKKMNNDSMSKDEINTYNKAVQTYVDKASSIFDKYYKDALGAKLKDIGMEDTAVGREMIQLVMSNSDWWNDFRNHMI